MTHTTVHPKLVDPLPADTPSMTWRLSVDGVCVHCSPAWLRFTGRSLAEELGYGWLGNVHHEDLAVCTSEFRQAVWARHGFTTRLRVRRADGLYRAIVVTGVPRFTVQGDLDGFDGSAVDITEQATADGHLTATDKRLGLPTDYVGLLFALVSHFDAMLVEGVQGQTLLTTPAFFRLFGGADTFASQSPVLEPSSDAARTQEIRSRAVSVNERVRWPDGRMLERDYTPLRVEGVLLAHMWRYIDVTTKYRSETAWFESKARLRELAIHAEEVRETERRHLGRMLHDDIGQAFTSIRMELATAITRFRETAIPDQIDLVDRLQHAAGLVDLGLVTVRQISTSLRPPVLDHLGLVAGIRWEAAEFERRWNIRCRVSAMPSELELDRDRSTAVYRILLEALTNVARHSRAGAVRIALLRRGGTLFLKIEDNGRGVSAADVANPRTMGLLGMRERALPFGGDVRVGSAPRGGTRVLAIIPV